MHLIFTKLRIGWIVANADNVLTYWLPLRVILDHGGRSLINQSVFLGYNGASEDVYKAQPVTSA